MPGVATALQHLAMRLPRPTWPGALAAGTSLVAAGVAAGRGDNLLLLAAALAAGLALAGIVLPPLLLRGLRVDCALPARVMAGVPVAVAVRVTGPNRWPGVPPCTVADQPSPTGGGGGTARVPGSASGDAAQASSVYHARFRRRGRHRVGVFVLETSAPFGFARAVRAGITPREILVLPRVRHLNLPALPDPRVAVRRQLWGRPSRSALEEEFAGLREWRPGENPKHIHWRTSARVQQLVMREHEAPSDRRVTVALETAMPDGADPTHGKAAARFERAVALAASVCAALEREGGAYRLALGGANPRCTRFGHGRAHLDLLLILLAEVAADPAGTAEATDRLLELSAPSDAAVIWVRCRPGEPPAAPGGTACLRPGAGRGDA